MKNKNAGAVSVVLVFGLLLIALFGIRTVSNPEIWMHLSTGRQIAEAGVPQTDPFAFSTEEDADWITVTPLYDRLVFSLWQAGGAPLVTLVHTAAVLAAFGLLLGASRRWGSPLSQGFALLLSAWILLPAFLPGPVLFGMLFLSLFVFLLERPVPSLVRWTGLILGQILWVNMHPSFILGPVILLFALVQRILESRELTGKHFMANSALIKQTGALLLLTLLLSLANPYGFGLPGYLLRNLKALILPHTAVFISPFSYQFSGMAFKKLVTLVMIVGAAGLITLKKKLPIMMTALAVLGAFLLVRSLFYVVFFVFMAFPFMVLSLDATGLFLKQSIEPMLKSHGSKLKPAMTALFAFCVAASAWGMISNSSLIRIGSASRFGLGEADTLYPQQLEALLTHPRFPKKALNLAFDGAYLSWAYPERKIYCDLRPEVFPKEFVENLNRGLSGDQDEWFALLNKWVPHAVILNNTWAGSGMTVRHLTNEKNRWKLAYFDGAYSVLLSPSSRNRLLIREMESDQKGLPLLQEAYAAYTQASGPIKPANDARLIGAAQVFNALGRHREAARFYKAILKQAPWMTEGWLGYGAAQHALGNAEEAIHALRRAVRQRPRSGNAWLGLYRAYAAAGREEEARAALAKAEKFFQPKDNVEEEEAPEKELPPPPIP
jgi:tetratricopeptide (TPR) repeat protein